METESYGNTTPSSKGGDRWSSGVTRREVLYGISALGIASSVSRAGAAGQSGNEEMWSWPAYRGHGQTGSTTATVPGDLDNMLWAVGSDDQGATLPVFDDGMVYVATGEQLRASDARTGRGGWAYGAAADVVGAPAIGETTVLVTLADGSIAAVDREDGSQRWRFGLSGTPGMPTCHDGTAYVGTHNGTVYAFDAVSGDLEWSVDEHARRANDLLQRPTPVVTDDAVYVNMTDTFSPDPTLHALDPGTGEERWTTSLPGKTMYPPAVSGDHLCVTVDASIFVLSATNGSTRWRRDVFEDGTPEVNAPAAIGHDTVAIVADRNLGEPHCVAYDLATGEERWSYQHDGTVPGGVAIADGMVYSVVITGVRSGDIIGLTLEDGLRRFHHELGANPDDPPSPVPTPFGLAVPAGSTIEFYGPEPDTTSTEDSRSGPGSDDDPSDPKDTEESEGPSGVAGDGGRSDGAGDRGFLTNDGDELPLLNVFYMTVLGFVLSVAGIVYQLKEGE